MAYFLMVFALLLPVSAAITMPLVFRLSSQKFRYYYPMAILACCAICCSVMALNAYSAAKPNEIALFFSPGFDLILSATPLTSLLATILSWSCLAAYIRCGAIPSVPSKHYSRFCSSFMLYSACIMAATFSGSLLWIYVFWQLSAICLWTMTGKSSNQEDNIKADGMMIRVSAGAALMLFAFVSIYLQYGTFNMGSLVGETVSFLQAFMISAGLIMPLAILPGITRMSVAGKPSYAVDFSLPASVMAIAGLCLYVRTICSCLAASQNFHIFITAVSFIAMGLFLWEFFTGQDQKKQPVLLSCVMLALAFPGFSSLTNMGMSGGIMTILATVPFLMAAMIVYGNKDKSSRLGYATAIISFLALAGLSPAGAFFSRFMVLCSIAQQGNPWIMSVYILSAIISVVAIVRLFRQFRLAGTATSLADMEAFVLSIIGLAVGLLVHYPSSYIVLTSVVHGVNLQ